MTRVALDSNLLIYAELEPETPKGQRAADMILRASHDGVIPTQVLGEYLRVIQRRASQAFPEAVRQADIYRAAFLTPSTTDELMAAASAIALAHHLQIWDCVILAAVIQSGAKVLLTEDLQDGRVLDGVRMINPFDPANNTAIDTLLAP